MAYKVTPFPAIRKLQSDVGAIAKSTNTFLALVEVDITRARKAISRCKQQTGETLSLTGFITCCLARCIERHPQVNALRNLMGNFVIFDEVDVNILVEKVVDGKQMAMVHVIRAANKKTFTEIHRDIRLAQQQGPAEVSDIAGREKWWQMFVAVPGFIRRMLWRALFLNPHWIKKMTGTVSLSAVGMAGKGGGWGIPNSNLTLSVISGGISERPVLKNGVLDNHEYLHLTFAFDHDVIDGAPATRFVSDLRNAIEAATELEDLAI